MKTTPIAILRTSCEVSAAAIALMTCAGMSREAVASSRPPAAINKEATIALAFTVCESTECAIVDNSEFIAALLDVDSATVSNAVEQLNVRDRTDGYADLRLRCLAAQAQPMVGYAVTLKIDSTTVGRPPESSRFADLMGAVAASPKPCVVVCQEAGPAPERGCHMGDVVGTKLARAGVVGLVSGSGIRDVDGIRDLGLTAFALGTIASHGVWTITEIGEEVEVAGLRIRSGDLLHGNGDGLVTVPADRPGDLLEFIAQEQAKESASKGALVDSTDLQH
jgi:4-hydroxy-4-methyl-2-oxoglutarate aldolase